jgi:membrane protease YdiL (CAAX protease family)
VSAPGGESTRDRVGWVVAVGLAVATYSHFYDLWDLPPRLPNAPGLILAGDVLPLLVVPVLFVRFVLREPLRRYGFAWPGARALLVGSFTAWIAMLPLVVWMAGRPEFQAFYPSPNFPTREVPLARMHVNGLFALWLLGHLPQMLATEFCFRGFLLFPLGRALGIARAIVILTAPYVLLHWTKPPLELVLALWGGVVFSAVAWRTGSFLPAFVSHWAVAVTMDWLCFRALHR